ncbi:hypothetical protein P7C70_g8198, partial [Phenoliferia sp. Uapishka_3]
MRCPLQSTSNLKVEVNDEADSKELLGASRASISETVAREQSPVDAEKADSRTSTAASDVEDVKPATSDRPKKFVLCLTSAEGIRELAKLARARLSEGEEPGGALFGYCFQVQPSPTSSDTDEDIDEVATVWRRPLSLAKSLARRPGFPTPRVGSASAKSLFPGSLVSLHQSEGVSGLVKHSEKMKIALLKTVKARDMEIGPSGDFLPGVASRRRRADLHLTMQKRRPKGREYGMWLLDSLMMPQVSVTPTHYSFQYEETWLVWSAYDILQADVDEVLGTSADGRKVRVSWKVVRQRRAVVEGAFLVEVELKAGDPVRER